MRGCLATPLIPLTNEIGMKSLTLTLTLREREQSKSRKTGSIKLVLIYLC
jgi:hypothetical protein